jgi:flagellar hook-basal body complex protein FliE
MDIRKSLAVLANSNAHSLGPQTPREPGFEKGAAKVLDAFTGILDRAEGTAMDAMTGEADPHSLVEALASSQTAVETVVTVRDRVVEAYQEILRMPV